jgi:Ni/Co efflux regulator RcnB
MRHIGLAGPQREPSFAGHQDKGALQHVSHWPRGGRVERRDRSAAVGRAPDVLPHVVARVALDPDRTGHCFEKPYIVKSLSWDLGTRIPAAARLAGVLSLASVYLGRQTGWTMDAF